MINIILYFFNQGSMLKLLDLSIRKEFIGKNNIHAPFKCC